MRPADATLTCRDCGGAFTFSEGECQAGNGRPAIAPCIRELQQVQTTFTRGSCGRCQRRRLEQDT